MIIISVGQVKYFQLHTCQAGHMSIFMHTVTYVVTMTLIMESFIRIQKRHSVFIQLWFFMQYFYLKLIIFLKKTLNSSL